MMGDFSCGLHQCVVSEQGVGEVLLRRLLEVELKVEVDIMGHRAACHTAHSVMKMNIILRSSGGADPRADGCRAAVTVSHPAAP